MQSHPSDDLGNLGLMAVVKILRPDPPKGLEPDDRLQLAQMRAQISDMIAKLDAVIADLKDARTEHRTRANHSHPSPLFGAGGHAHPSTPTLAEQHAKALAASPTHTYTQPDPAHLAASRRIWETPQRQDPGAYVTAFLQGRDGELASALDSICDEGVQAEPILGQMRDSPIQTYDQFEALYGKRHEFRKPDDERTLDRETEAKLRAIAE